MAYENKRRDMDDNTLLLFANEQARGEKDPKYKGFGKQGGVDVWVSAWANRSKDGKPYLKIKTKPKQEQRRESYERSQQPFDDRNPPPPSEEDFMPF